MHCISYPCRLNDYIYDDDDDDNHGVGDDDDGDDDDDDDDNDDDVPMTGSAKVQKPMSTLSWVS